jgi:ComF family protein
VKSSTYRLYHLVWSSLDWLYPPKCIYCTKTGFQICPDCQNLILHLKQPLCIICGLPITAGSVCSKCKKNRPSYILLRSWAVYTGPVQKAIQRIKYKRDLSLGNELARYVSLFVNDMHLDVVDVIPVPLGKKRLRDRGYNQVSIIAFPLALKLGLNYIPRGLVRIRETESQVGLNVKERNENVKDAFLANPRHVAGKNILLIDDVATTGATLTSCTNALRLGGASNVFAVTLARALGSHGLSHLKGN